MKKLLRIMVLGLFLSGCASTPQMSTSKKRVTLESKLPIGSTKKDMCKVSTWNPELINKGGAVCHSFNSDSWFYFPDTNTEIITNGWNIFLIYENVTQRMTCKLPFCKHGNGTLKKIMYSKSDNKSDIQEALRAAIEYANPSRKKVEKKKKTTTNTTTTVNKLQDLIKDFESGKISKKEFDKKKKELIGN